MKQSQTWSAEAFACLETLYHNANGYLGVRNAPEEGSAPGSIRGTYLNGFYELMDITYGEKLYGFPETKQVLVNVPDAQTLTIEANGQRYSMFDEAAADRLQTLDIEQGITRRESKWNGLKITFTRMVSFVLPNVFALRLTLASESYSGPVRLCSSLNGDVRNHAAQGDPRVAAEPLRCLRVLETGVKDDAAWLKAETLRSQLQLSCCVAHSCDLPCKWEQEGALLSAAFEGELQPGQTIELVKYAVYTDSMRTDDLLDDGWRILDEARKLGFSGLASRQHDAMQALIRDGFIRLDAPGPLAQALDYDLFELIQSTGWDGVSNVAAKGISGEGYEGHTFWDSEIYVFPFFLWTQPQVARGMLTYRYALLDRARANARTMGMSTGALYPWRTINGDECSAFFPAGTAQYHINGDIAYAFMQYWHVTGDAQFMAEMGAEVLVETARAWMELGHMADDGFRIDCVTGPDEYTCLVNNNFYTNAVAQANLRGAAEVVRELEKRGMAENVRAKTGVTDEELQAFSEAARRMYLPCDPVLGISPQDDSFLQKKKLDWRSLPREQFPLLLHYHPLYLYRHQVCKQADTVLAHLLFPDTADEETICRSYQYYDEVTTHDSSLSLCVFAIMAARLGMMERAKEGFAGAVTLDLLDTHGNTKDGLHTASMGGAYLALLRGFAGIRADADGLQIDPVLPDGWNGYEIPFAYHGRRLLCSTHAGKEPEVRLLSGEPLALCWRGKRQMLTDTL